MLLSYLFIHFFAFYLSKDNNKNFHFVHSHSLIKLALVDNVGNLPEEERQDILSTKEVIYACRTLRTYIPSCAYWSP
jgi:hypothetical protein